MRRKRSYRGALFLVESLELRVESDLKEAAVRALRAGGAARFSAAHFDFILL